MFDMKTKTIYCFFTLLFLAYALPVRGDDGLKRGLYFQSFEVDMDKRTCLDLTPHKPLIFNHGFTMEFGLNLRNYDQTFGYVFRIICNDTTNIDFLSNITAETTNFSIVIKNRTVIQYRNAELGRAIEGAWIHVQFVYDPDDNRISLTMNGIQKEAPCELEDLHRFNVYFGGNTHGIFATTDVVPMTVKEIRLYNEKKNPVRFWELGKHSSNILYDEYVSDKAVVRNPIWEIDRHAKWEKRKTMAFAGKNYRITFHQEAGRFYFVGDRRIYTYDMNRQNEDVIEVAAGLPFSIDRTNQVVYDPNRNVLLSYDFEGLGLATFDFSTRCWDNLYDLPIMPRFSHHSRLFITEDSLLVTFGGYGLHRYNSMFYKYRVNQNTYDVTDLTQAIPPRYLGSIGRYDNRHILYFGGYGNESGLQEEFPRNYYDLYSIQIDSLEVKKIWELPNPDEHFTNSNAMVIDKTNRKFYALAYANKRYASMIMLHEYDLDTPKYRVVGDSIPYFFSDIESYCDLYQSFDDSELIALTSYVRDNNTYITIYTLAFPPLCPNEIKQNFSPRSSLNLLIWIIIFVVGVGMTGILILYRKRKTGQTTAVHSENEEESMTYENLLVEKKPSSISLLGNFHVVDSAGYEITKDFTPTTTNLFLLLLMSTIKNGYGCTSTELQKILWFDKDELSAKNNRSVYISKLRSILKSFQEVRIMNSGGFWSVQSEKKGFCDYERVLVLMKTLQEGDSFNKKWLTELVDIALKGTLLPHIQQPEWLESYQSDYTNQLIECLLKYSARDEVKTDFVLLLKIADAILLHDDIDEDAIRLKCYALFRLGRKNQALQAFNKFTADYKNLLATHHNMVFENLIKPV